ncbi:MAG: alpha/beta hydrolase [Candidatus Levybacteria bacterium]|nr:alpha/beta hydrolase [Candidatus Levybacteria bacterium]
MTKQTIIILHGWGLNGSLYNSLAGILKERKYTVYNPDLPGFGKEPLGKNLGLDDYADFLDKFIEKNNVHRPILIGHSFGGRIAIKYVWKNPEKVSKLILTGVPIIRQRTLQKKIGFLAAKTGGKVFIVFPKAVKNKMRKLLYFAVGERDYYKLDNSPLKKVFKNIISEDLTGYLREIKIPILLVWGENDVLTPSWMLPKITKISPNAKIVLVPQKGHKLPYANYSLFFESIKNFI